MHSSKFAVLLIAHLISVLEAKPSKNLVTMPIGCENKNYCFEINDDYPQMEVDKIIQDMGMEAVTEEETESRNGPEIPEYIIDSNQPCQKVKANSSARVRYIVDTNDIVRYVVQSNGFFEQKPSVISCRKPGPMTEPQDPFTAETACLYSVTCVEQLVPIKFLVLKNDKSGVEVATIKDGLPMGCACQYVYPPSGQKHCPKDTDYYRYNPNDEPQSDYDEADNNDYNNAMYNG